MPKAVRKPQDKPRTRNPEATRRKLLESSTALFSQRGYDGVSVDEIVEGAGCNKRMLYHYYGNKDGMYTEVLRTVFSKLENYELKTSDTQADPEEAYQALLERYFDFLEENPDFTRLLMWENLHNGRFLEEHPDILTKGPVVERLDELSKHDSAENPQENKDDLRHVLVLLIGLCSIHFSNQYTLKHTTGLDLTNPKVRRRGLEHAKRLILSGILNGSESDPSTGK